MSSTRTDSVTSPDGTTIGYRSRGRGPGLIVLHGGMESSADYADLADALADTFTVHVLDRRGRGLSGPHGPAYGLPTEVGDVRAVARATGAGRVFGVSSGGVIALQAGLDLPEIGQVAAYEPAVSAPGDAPGSDEFIRRYQDAVDRGQTAQALITMLRGMQVGPRWLRLLPRRLAVFLIGKFIEEEQNTAAADEVSFVSLVPTMHFDFRIATEDSTDLQRFSALAHPVLLLGGSKSPRYLKAAVTMLAETLPHARRVQLPGANHTTASNHKQGGRPDLVASELLDFFTPADAARTG